MRLRFGFIVIFGVSLAAPALAQEPAPTPPAPEPTPTVAPTEPAPPPPAPPPPKVVPADDPKRETSLTPVPAEPPPETKAKFTADPVGDGATLVLGLTFGILSGEILSTGEIQPQQISAKFSTSQLLGIDRGAIHQTLDSHADRNSNFGLYAAALFAVADSVADIWREGKTAALVDAVMYGEAASITAGLTNVAKIAFRRPRPVAYIARNQYIAKGGDPATYDNTDTDSALSFFSAHTAQVSALTAAATYIAFKRAPKGSVRPWITLGAGALLTAFVGYERVRSGQHFPTDVIAGALVGTGTGALVVHLHREDDVKSRPVWIGASPGPGGGMLTAGGIF